MYENRDSVGVRVRSFAGESKVDAFLILSSGMLGAWAGKDAVSLFDEAV